MILYVYDKYKGNKTSNLNTEELVALALRQYAVETGVSNTLDDITFKIFKTQKGKPFVEGLPLHFSVSHSDCLWVCLIGDSENGVDIQDIRNSNYEAIAQRFFQPEEQKAVAAGGVASFISIWCRKEAFIKLFGMTIGDTINWLNVANDETPATQIKYMDQTIMFSDIDIHPGYLCVAAMNKKEEIWIRNIQTD
jgi:4'-phosphopantetheinyl transferase